jgi:hypothetical protein
MHQIYPDVGLLAWLTRMITGDFHYHLYVNNFTPDRDTSLGALTEMAIAGYAIVTVTAAQFTLSGVAGHVGSVIAPPIAFLNGTGGSEDAFGYFVTKTDNTTLLIASRFDGAPLSKVAGDYWVVTPTLSDLSQFAS